MSSLWRTIEALKKYDDDRPRRQALWDNAASEVDIKEAQRVDEEAADKVREAFALDTAHVNSRERSYMIHPDDAWLRRVAV